MYQVSELIGQKGSGAATIGPQASVLEAARMMNERRIGSLVVVDGEGCVIGIITERDIMTRVVAPERQPSRTRVEDVMTPEPITCAPETPLEELRCLMRERRVRHIPVLQGGRLSGMVSIGDLNVVECQDLNLTIGYLKSYIAG
jgi:CBS domain-containing protein